MAKFQFLGFRFPDMNYNPFSLDSLPVDLVVQCVKSPLLVMPITKAVLKFA
jgi:hypothetical protein